MRYRTIVADPPWPIGDFPPHAENRQAGRPRLHRDTGLTPYPTMTLEDIAHLPVATFAAPEAHLYLWTTAGYLRDAYSIAEAWGFAPQIPLVWCKPSMGIGLGGKFTSNVEFVLFCRERHGAVRITSFLADAAQAAGLTARDVNREMGTSDMAGWWLSRLPHRSRIPTWEQWERLRGILGFDDSLDEDVRAVNEHRHDERKVDTRWFTWARGAHSAKPEAFLDLVEQVSPGPYLEMFSRRARLGWDTHGNESLHNIGGAA